MLVADHIQIQHGCRVILEDASIIVPEAQIIGLLGPSGCGKSSLLSLLAGLDVPQAGDIRYISKLPDQRAAVIGVVFQKLALWPHLTLQQNVLLARKFHKLALSTKEISQYAQKLGISSVLDQYPSQASLGEQQRVAFLRALAIRPQYLLLDEPTSALDERSMQSIEEILQERRNDGVGILLVSHDRLLAERLCDRMFSVRDRKIVAEQKMIYPQATLTRTSNAVPAIQH